MEELSAIFTVVKEGASLGIMLWFMLRRGKTSQGADRDPGQECREEVLTEAADLDRLHRLVRRFQETPGSGLREGGNLSRAGSLPTRPIRRNHLVKATAHLKRHQRQGDKV